MNIVDADAEACSAQEELARWADHGQEERL